MAAAAAALISGAGFSASAFAQTATPPATQGSAQQSAAPQNGQQQRGGPNGGQMGGRGGKGGGMQASQTVTVTGTLRSTPSTRWVTTTGSRSTMAHWFAFRQRPRWMSKPSLPSAHR
ncbi:MAG TPA: hypothetical protein PKY60_09935 [Thermoflexales bacterium]|nr:hypothetical protein [Thermoflexales bacterium]